MYLIEKAWRLDDPERRTIQDALRVAAPKLRLDAEVFQDVANDSPKESNSRSTHERLAKEFRERADAMDEILESLS